MKLDFDIESNILEWISELEPGQCAIISDFEESENYHDTVRVLETLSGDRLFDRWRDNSASVLPPDFIDEKDSLMMEVMRFDDHSPDGKKNPNLARQREMSKELEPIMHIFPSAKHVMAIALTDLPTEKDHNYRFYYNGFKRTVKKHLAKAPSYRKNHPGKRLVFLAVDESSGVYFERAPGDEETNFGKLHIPFFDTRFLEAFERSDLDYLILFCPFNHYKSLGKHLKLPNLIIFDVKNMAAGDMLQRIDYDEARMISSEK